MEWEGRGSRRASMGGPAGVMPLTATYGGLNRPADSRLGRRASFAQTFRGGNSVSSLGPHALAGMPQKRASSTSAE